MKTLDKSLGRNTTAQKTQQTDGIRRRLAADLLDRALKGSFSNLHYHVCVVIDADLIESDRGLAVEAESIVARINAIELPIGATFPLNNVGRAAKFHNDDVEFAQEVDVFRQELFWTKGDLQSLRNGEDVIEKMHEIYRAVEKLVRHLDSIDDECVAGIRNEPPSFRANPYFKNGR